jgi:hypothetical protein
MKKLMMFVMVMVFVFVGTSETESFSTTFSDDGCSIEVRMPFIGPLGGEDKEWALKFSIVIQDPEKPGHLKLLPNIYEARFIKKEGGVLVYKYKLPFTFPFWARYWGEGENFSCQEIPESDQWLYIDQSSRFHRPSCNGSPGYEQIIFPREKIILPIFPEWELPCRP